MWIAEEQVVFVTASGDRIPGRIAIGKPEHVTPEEVHCPIALDGLYPRVGPIIGASSVQALLLAVRFLGTILHGFTSRGGRVVDPADDSDMAIEASFGPLLRDPEPPAADEDRNERPSG